MKTLAQGALPLLQTYDENMEPCTILSDFLGSPHHFVARELVRASIGGVMNVDGSIYFSDGLPAGVEPVGTDPRTDKVIACNYTTAGGGPATVLGLNWTHVMCEHGRMLITFMNRYPPASDCPRWS